MKTVDHSAATPWVEKYRPKSLKDVSHQTEVIATLQNATETGRLPHLLFYGPPGSGKVNIYGCCSIDSITVHTFLTQTHSPTLTPIPPSDIRGFGSVSTTLASVSMASSRVGIERQ
jgi:Holliday junction resolvasome RuvABC ATP-dependent DNA helicase subunit